jgi:hypothetical protein
VEVVLVDFLHVEHHVGRVLWKEEVQTNDLLLVKDFVHRTCTTAGAMENFRCVNWLIAECIGRSISIKTTVVIGQKR